MTAKIVIYTTATCPYCDWAKQLLDTKKATYQEVRVDLDLDQRAEMVRLTGRRSVPQIFINDQPIGGFDDLTALDKAGKLDPLLNLNQGN
jgi:glutaredoxin 3